MAKKEVKLELIKKKIAELERKSFDEKYAKQLEHQLKLIAESNNKSLEKSVKTNDTKRERNCLKAKEDVNLAKEMLVQIYLNYYNSLNNTTFTLDELKEKYNINIYKKSFSSLIESDFSKKEKNSRVLKNFNDNPKDDYPDARSMKRHFIIHTGATNTGKTYNALQRLKESQNGAYLGPLRLLALEIFERLNDDGCTCSLRTGEEEVIIENSRVVSSTIEMANLSRVYDVVVIDEAQLMADEYRGAHWTKAVLGICCKEIHICCSLNAMKLIKSIIKDTGDTCEVHQYERKTPLILEEKLFSFPDDVQDGDAFIVFSRRKVLETAEILKNAGFKSSVLYGNLPPDTRRKQINLFTEKETTVIATTDCIGLGVNLPIKRIVFLELEKFDGNERRLLKSQEIKQIAGRAGRQGIYDKGYVATVYDKEFLRNGLYEKDETIKKAYILPDDDTLLSIKSKILMDKLQVWKQHSMNMELYLKANIDNQIELLEDLYEDYILSFERDMLKMIKIPFDLKDGDLRFLWKQYCHCLIDNIDFKVPTLEEIKLDELETYYAKLDLYFSMCKSFKIDFDYEEIVKEKELTSELINKELIRRIIAKNKRCKKCGEIIPSNISYSICNKCYAESLY